ncbi:MAG: ABC transporter permease subunit [Roseburia sp.]|nr:ABC transporter permease subunit [Roseburia sp.]
MKTVFTIIKKEFARFFKDTRLWVTAIILPGLLIFALYSIMGTIMESSEKKSGEYIPEVYIEGLPDSQPHFGDVFNIKDKENYNYSSAVEAVKEGELDLYIIFPQDFDKLVENYDNMTGVAPNVRIYYNSSNANSVAAYNLANVMLNAYEETLCNKFDINRQPASDYKYDLADEQGSSKMVLSMVVPMLLLMLLFSGCMAVAPESIAGEKERGTIATLLVTPAKRSHIAIGKIAALSVIALLSGLSSALGLLLSLPKLMGSADGMSISMYGIGDYTVILAVVLSTVLVLVTLISIVSAYAKSVKEANGLVVPLMIVVMLCGVFSMFAAGAASIGFYFIPVFNSALVISKVLSGTISPFAPLITVCVNVAFAALLIFVLTRMFNSERIMFNR